MIRRPITYTFIDDEDKEITETESPWFHIFEEEMIELEAKYPSGLVNHLQNLVKEADNEKIFEFFRKIILDSYGQRADGGRRFDKSPEIRKTFQNTLAYKQLFKELCSNETAAAEFINGIFPKVVNDQDKPQIAAAVPTKTTP